MTGAFAVGSMESHAGAGVKVCMGGVASSATPLCCSPLSQGRSSGEGGEGAPAGWEELPFRSVPSAPVRASCPPGRPCTGVLLRRKLAAKP